MTERPVPEPPPARSVSSVIDATFSWQRYWLPRSVRPQRDAGGDGFLQMPGRTTEGPTNLDAVRTSELGSRRLLILHGEPAVGKTQAISRILEESAAEQFSAKIAIACRAIDPSDGLGKTLERRAEWISWLNDTGNLLLVIDGIDEGIIAMTNFVPAMVEFIRLLPLAARQRLHLILTCRTADWAPYQTRESELLRHLDVVEIPAPDPVAFELCPLTAKDAVDAASQCGLDGGAFLAATRAMHIEGLAAFPFTLKMLLLEFQQGTLKFKSRRELYLSFARKACANAHDPERQASLGPVAATLPPVERLLEAAAYLAACMITAGKRGITTQSFKITGNDMALDEISSWPADGKSPSAHELNSALHTGIYACHAGLFTFLHQSMAECLAADILSQRPLVQLSSLLLRHDSAGRHVVPQLAQTASWLSEQHSDLFEVLLADDPETLLRSDVSHHSPSQKARMVDVLLARAKSGQMPPNANLHLSGLKYAGIVRPLRAGLTEAQEHFEVGKICLKIIAESEVHEMEDDLWAFLVLPDMHYGLRVDAGVALQSLLETTQPESLLRLLNREILACDANDEIRGLALRALVPRYLPVSKVFDYLTRPKSTVIGLYRLFVFGELLGLMGPDDLPAALRFLRTIDIEDEDEPGYRDPAFMTRVVNAALTAIDHPSVATELAAFWLGLSEERISRYSLGNHSPISKRLADDSRLRRRLVGAILQQDDFWATQPKDERVSSIFSNWYMPLLQSGDLIALLHEWSTASVPLKPRLAQVIRTGLSYGFQFIEVSARASTELLNFLKTEPGCEELVDFWVKPWDLSSDRVRKQRLAAAEERKWQQKMQETQKQPDWAESVAQMLENTKRHPSWYARLVEMLHFGPHWKRDRESASFSLPGLAHLTDEQRNAVKHAARRFVLECAPGTTGRPSNFDEAAYHAVILYFDFLNQDKELRAAVTGKWLQALVWSYDNDQDTKRKILGWAYQAQPDGVRHLIARQLRSEATNEKGIIVITQVLGQLCDVALAREVIRLLGDPAIKPGAVEYLTGFLAAYDAKYLFDHVKQFDGRPWGQMPASSWPLLLGHALHAAPGVFWTWLHPLLAADMELGRQVLTATASHRWHHGEMPVELVTARDFSAMLRLMAQAFPIANDPPFKSGIQEQSPARNVAELRGYLADQLAKLGTDEACDELRQLADDLPEGREGLLWRYHSARHQSRLSRWIPPTPREVAALIRRTDARLVRDEHELLQLVVESLERYQRRLSGSNNPRLSALWEIEGPPQSGTIHRPRAEEYLAGEVAAWLQDDLGPRHGVIINREVVPRLGQRTDIHVEALAIGSSSEPTVRVVIEVKGSWHPEIKTALKSQLVDEYLANQTNAAGLYLVCWFGQDSGRSNKMDSKTATEAAAETASWGKPYRNNSKFAVGTILLNCEFEFAAKRNPRKIASSRRKRTRQSRSRGR